MSFYVTSFHCRPSAALCMVCGVVMPSAWCVWPVLLYEISRSTHLMRSHVVLLVGVDWANWNANSLLVHNLQLWIELTHRCVIFAWSRGREDHTARTPSPVCARWFCKSQLPLLLLADAMESPEQRVSVDCV